MDNNKEVRIDANKIHLASIRPLIDSVNIDPTMVVPPTINYNINFEIGSGLSFEANLVRVVIKAMFNGIDDQNNDLGINGEYSCEFVLKIDDLADFVIKDPSEDGLVVLHGVMAGTVLGICYSTFRGIVFSRSKNVLAAGIILPVLDPTKLPVIKAPTPYSSSQQ